ncbi:MAG: 3-phenylpropionate MFS transporter [Rhodospirillaceae bacterium]|nr:3-phenylpropionate MFS transporter [Rhodospirillales bacterium]
MTGKAAAFRLAAFYCALFAAVGVQLPFWPLWLKDRGLSPGDIGLILAATYLMKMVVNPLVGHVVDRRGDRRRPMTIMAVGAALTWACFAFVGEFWGILAVTVLSLSLWSGIMPVGESLALMITQRHRLDYGRVRLWGSAAFILTAIGVGRLLVDHPPTILVWLIAGLLGLMAFACAALPDARVPVSAEGNAPLRPLLTSAGFLLFLAAGSLNQVSHTVYYAFSTIHWKAAGIADDTIGLLWSEGVIAEIVLFSMSGHVVRRVGPAGLILIAALCGVVRWGVLGATTELPLLFAAQILHGATFGCAHLGAMHYIQRTIPAGLSARAQGIYSAVAMGAAPGLMSPLTGRLYESLGGYAFMVMAGFSLLSALAAWRMVRPGCGRGGAM